MAATFTIGGTVFAALGPSAGRKALSCSAGAPREQLIRYHVPGVDGNYLTRGGRLGVPHTCRARYVGAFADVLAGITADQAAWSDAYVTIVDAAGQTWVRCQLESARVLGEPAPLGRGGLVFQDVEYVFVSE